jgi:hypothetical protein
MREFFEVLEAHQTWAVIIILWAAVIVIEVMQTIRAYVDKKYR